LLDSRPGFVAFMAEGKNASVAFKNEAGGHRWQRIPPTEKRGRVHTSTITVAVLPELQKTSMSIRPEDLRWKFCRGQGKGGQHRNKTDSAVQLTHTPSGESVHCESEREQSRNKQLALRWLTTKLNKAANGLSQESRNSNRRQQLGTGMRGDKIRTIRVQDGVVKNNLTGKKVPFSRYERGDFKGL
jgi:peptide chain release factor 1